METPAYGDGNRKNSWENNYPDLLFLVFCFPVFCAFQGTPCFLVFGFVFQGFLGVRKQRKILAFGWFFLAFSQNETRRERSGNLMRVLAVRKLSAF